MTDGSQQVTAASTAKASVAAPVNDPFSFSPVTRVIAEPPHYMMRGGVYLLTLVVATGLTWASLTDVPKYVNAAGDIFPSEELSFVQAVHGGNIIRILAPEGTQVTADQSLFEIESDRLQELYREVRQRQAELALARDARAQVLQHFVPDTEKKIVSARERIEKLGQLEKLTTDRKNNVQGQVSIELGRQQARLDLSERQVTVDEQLRSMGYTSERNVLVSKLGVKEVESEIDGLNARQQESDIAFNEETLKIAIQVREANEEIMRLDGEMTAALRTADADVQRAAIQLDRARASINEFGLEAEEEISEAAPDTRTYFVKAPESGILTDVKAANPGQVVSDGEVLARLVPRDARLQARLQVSDGDISQVRLGDTVRFEVNAFPSVDHGALSGKIVRISPTAEDVSGARTFLIYADLEQAYFKVEGHRSPLLPGMLGVGEIRVGKERMIARLFKPFKALFDPQDAER